MTRQGFIKRLTEQFQELNESEGFDAVMVIQDIENTVKAYEKECQKDSDELPPPNDGETIPKS